MQVEKMTDWHRHYFIDKKKNLDFSEYKEAITHDQPFISFLGKYVKPRGRILECGSGLGRNVLSLINKGYRVIGLDIDSGMVAASRKFAKAVKVKAKFVKGDIFQLDKKFRKDRFDVITSHGVLDRYKKREIRKLIEKQLEVAPLILFAVPLNTSFNKIFFSKKKYVVFRNLLTQSQWKREILKAYNVLETKRVRQRTDNLFAVIAR